jgi:hypothetical protein
MYHQRSRGAGEYVNILFDSGIQKRSVDVKLKSSRSMAAAMARESLRHAMRMTWEKVSVYSRPKC